MEQLLRQKRDELAKRWQEREERLEAARRKEKAQEDRARKRRRVDEVRSQKWTINEDDEFLLDVQGDDAASHGSGDAQSGLSKEAREVLARFGLGIPKKNNGNEETDLFEEGVKVRRYSCSHLVANIKTIENRSITLQERIPSCPNSSPSFADRSSPRHSQGPCSRHRTSRAKKPLSCYRSHPARSCASTHQSLDWGRYRRSMIAAQIYSRPNLVRGAHSSRRKNS